MSSLDRDEAASIVVHGTTVALGDRAVLLRGASGAGKSDLALRFLAAQGQWPAAMDVRRLVADDQTRVEAVDGGLVAVAPPILAGKLEVRGVGIVACDFRPRARLTLVVDLVLPEQIERMPERKDAKLLGIAVPLQALAPFEDSAAVKLCLMLCAAN